MAVAPRFGLSLPNRGVLFGATSVDELLELSEQAEASCAFDSIWVGDSLFAKPRLESLVLLSAIAARTRRVRLGTCCLSTFPLRDPARDESEAGARRAAHRRPRDSTRGPDGRRLDDGQHARRDVRAALESDPSGRA